MKVWGIPALAWLTCLVETGALSSPCIENMGLCLPASGLAHWSYVLTAPVGWGEVTPPSQMGNQSGRQCPQALRVNLRSTRVCMGLGLSLGPCSQQQKRPENVGGRVLNGTEGRVSSFPPRHLQDG